MLKKVTNALRAANIPATPEPSRCPDMEDDQVMINEDLYVQIGYVYLSVNEWKDGVCYHTDCGTVEEVVAKVKELL